MKRFLYDIFQSAAYYSLVKEIDGVNLNSIPIISYAYIEVLNVHFKYSLGNYKLYLKRHNNKLEFGI